MKQVFIDFVDDLKCVELTDKGWNIVATTLLVLAGAFWLGFADCGDIFKLIGCAGYIASAGLWITKSGWGKRLMNDLFDNDDMIQFDE